MTNPGLLPARRSAFRGFLLLAVVGLSLQGTARAQFRSPRRGGQDPYLRSSRKFLAAFREVVASPAECTVRVRCADRDVALGTVVGEDGWVLTKASELNGKVTCELRDGRELEAKVVGVHKDHDLALLKVEAHGLTPAKWVDSTKAPVGSWVAAPGMGKNPVAVGVVSVATRSVSGRRHVPSTNPSSGYLGISFDPDDAGVKVLRVMPGSAAARAGLKSDDRILSVGDRKIEGPEGLINVLRSSHPGQVLRLHVRRGEEELEVKVTLAKRPFDRGDFQNHLGSALSNHRSGFPTILQHDSVLRPEDCGGPLVDLDGHVIGINIARAGRTESYAVPAEAVRKLLPELKSGKLAEKVPAPKRLSSRKKTAEENAEPTK